MLSDEKAIRRERCPIYHETNNARQRMFATADGGEGCCSSTSSQNSDAACKAMIHPTHALPVATASLTVGIARSSTCWRVSLGFMHHCFIQPMRTYASEHVSISCCAMIGKTPGVDEVHCATWPVFASLNTAGVVHAQSASGTIAAASNRLVLIVRLGRCCQCPMFGQPLYNGRLIEKFSRRRMGGALVFGFPSAAGRKKRSAGTG